MKKTAGMALTALAIASCFSAHAQQDGAADGETLYNKQCSVCHGLMPGPSGRLPRPGMLAAASGHEASPPVMRDAGILAVAPIYGPPLQGVVGREAGTYQGYTYSKSFMQKMTGKKWDEGSIDAWITSSQKVVPGSFMFYSQKDAGIRGKIIAYLKTR
jgi:cytochrome c2